MSEELRPCPFCNIPPASKTSKIDGKEYYSCFNADCPNVSWFTADEWNTRPIEDALNARIAELECQLEDWAEGFVVLIAELEEEVTKGNELQDSYCDRIAKLEAYVAELEAETEVQE